MGKRLLDLAGRLVRHGIVALTRGLIEFGAPRRWIDKKPRVYGEAMSANPRPGPRNVDPLVAVGDVDQTPDVGT